jgi:hypothetical protein
MRSSKTATDATACGLQAIAAKELEVMRGKPWSTQDDGDLKRTIRAGGSLKDAAGVLGRRLDEVQRRLRVLGSRMPGASPFYREPD